MKLKTIFAVLILVVAFGLQSCGGKKGGETADGVLSGTVRVDGSSTVFPITEAVAEEFRNEAPRVKVTVGVSGTGGGFKKYVLGETDINDASRPIKDSEARKAAENGIEFIELPIAFDGISIVVNKENTWADRLTVEELNLIWKAGSSVRKWSQVREGWPDVEIALFGPGTDSGTFDYFTEVINGKSQSCRSDYTMSEDDNVLVMGVAGEKGSLGFFGFAYYLENMDKIKAVAVDNGKEAVLPSAETINNGSYSPLSRPIFIYVNPASLEKPQVTAFVDFYLKSVKELAREVGYVELSDEAYSLGKSRVAERVTGSVFNRADHGVGVEELLRH